MKPEMLFAPEIFPATAVCAGSKSGEEELAWPSVPAAVLGLVIYTVRA